MKLSLMAQPTFFADVPIPVAGKGEVKVKFEFKHRTRDELEAWLKSRGERTDVQAMLDMVKSWELDDEFNAENMTTLLQSYVGAARATIDTYIDHLIKGRSGN